MINNDKNSGVNFGQNGKFVIRKGVKVVMDKPCTQLSTVSVDNAITA
jgi:hypothetical protein